MKTNEMPVKRGWIPKSLGLTKALLLAGGFYFVIWLVMIFLDPLIPRMTVQTKTGAMEKVQVNRKGEIKVLRPEPLKELNNPNPPSGAPKAVPEFGASMNPQGAIIIDTQFMGPSCEINDEINSRPVPAHGLKLATHRGTSLEYWYFVKHSLPEPHGYFQGFQVENRKPIGFICRNGFQENRPDRSECLGFLDLESFVISPPESGFGVDRFPSGQSENDPWMYALEQNRRVWIATSEGISEVNLGTRTFQRFAPLKDVRNLFFMMDYGRQPLIIIARTPQAFHFFDESGKQIALAEYPWKESSHVEMFLPDTNEPVLVDKHRDARGNDPETEVTIYRFDGQGKLIQKYDERLVQHETPGNDTQTKTVVHIGQGAQTVMGGSQRLLDYWKNFISKTAIPGWTFYDLANLILTAVVIGMMAVRQSRYSQPWTTTIIWAVFLLLFGVGGWLGYRFSKRWPMLVNCNDCHKKRPVNQWDCPHCGKAFEKPTVLGTEILVSHERLALAQIA